MNKSISVSTIINKDIESVWKAWTNPMDITKWAFATDDWECPYATNDLSIGGRFMTKMKPKNSEDGFDFTGTYTVVETNKEIAYTIDDGRKVKILFKVLGPNETEVTEDFDLENENPEEMQRTGWQQIMNNFKKHVEGTH